MPALFRILKRRGRCVIGVSLGAGLVALAGTLSCAAAAEPSPAAAHLLEAELSPALIVTNLQQVRDCARFQVLTTLPIRLEGITRYAAATGNLVLLSDASGLAPVELDLNQNPVRCGQRVRCEGWARFGGGHAFLLPGPVVNNDGSHAEQQSSGRRYLRAGWHPLRVVYYQNGPPFALTVQYAGPGFDLRPIPPEALFHPASPSGNPAYLSGLEFKYVEGWWSAAPDFAQLTPLKTGVVPDFSLAPRQREENYAFEFNGSLRVERDGYYTFQLSSDDGSLLYVGEQALHVHAQGPATALPGRDLGTPRALRLGQPLEPEQDYLWSVVEGTVSFASQAGSGWELELSSDTGRMRVLVAQPGGGSLDLLRRGQVRARGFCQGVRTLDGDRVAGVLLTPGIEDLELVEAPPDQWHVPATSSASQAPVLTTAEQVRHLKPEEAQRAYPVRLRGIITDRHMESRAVLQDATSAIYVSAFPVESWRIPVGHYCELEGVSNPGGFAPTVLASKVIDLGPCQFPEPIRAAYDQLASGSLDCQWVEIEGMVRQVSPGEMQVAVKGGQVAVDIIDRHQAEALNSLSNAFVRVRGCAVPWFNEARQVIGGVLLRVPSITFITVDEAPPRDPFAFPAKRVAELLEFDPRKSPFKWVKVTGQVVLAAEGRACLMDGPTNGLRFLPRQPVRLAAGDEVEVVGVPELGGPSPLLRQALVRQTGKAALPPARPREVDHILQGGYDATRVELQGRLVNVRSADNALALEIQAGLRTFEARLPAGTRASGLPPLGSRVALTGVVVSQRRTESGTVDGFSLWLNAATDVRCLERPPRWTLKQALGVIGVLATAVLLAALWITLLRRQVEQRTRQLRAEMDERREAEARVADLELLQALESERARIARNIHDDLGARATRLSRLVGTLRARADGDTETKRPLEDISLVCRQMVQALDETVWTVNPTNDSLAHLADYITHFADEFFRGTEVRCQLGIPLDLPEQRLTTEFRHNVFLIVKEALNNALKHANARIVTLGLSLEGDGFRLTISDDGQGFAPHRAASGNGLANMRARVKAMGGRIAFESQPGHGTTIHLEIPILDASARPNV